jgi:hypothetical protein
MTVACAQLDRGPAVRRNAGTSAACQSCTDDVRGEGERRHSSTARQKTTNRLGVVGVVGSTVAVRPLRSKQSARRGELSAAAHHGRRARRARCAGDRRPGSRRRRRSPGEPERAPGAWRQTVRPPAAWSAGGNAEHVAETAGLGAGRPGSDDDAHGRRAVPRAPRAGSGQRSRAKRVHWESAAGGEHARYDTRARSSTCQ